MCVIMFADPAFSLRGGLGCVHTTTIYYETLKFFLCYSEEFCVQTSTNDRRSLGSVKSTKVAVLCIPGQQLSLCKEACACLQTGQIIHMLKMLPFSQISIFRVYKETTMVLFPKKRILRNPFARVQSPNAMAKKGITNVYFQLITVSCKITPWGAFTQNGSLHLKAQHRKPAGLETCF